MISIRAIRVTQKPRPNVAYLRAPFFITWSYGGHAASRKKDDYDLVVLEESAE